MAKGGKLTKIKSVLKKMQSFKLGRAAASSIAADDNYGSFDSSAAVKDLHTVYVGKSRRRYLLPSEVIDNPVFRELVERRLGEEEEEEEEDYSDSIVIGCEVVLFEHLLWMLENADPQPESLNELVEFYAC